MLELLRLGPSALLLALLASSPALSAQKICASQNLAPNPAQTQGALAPSWFAFPMTLRATTTLTALEFYCSTNSRFRNDANGRVGIYSDNGGRPGRLLTSAPFVVSRGVYDWYGAPFPSPLRATAGRYYVAFRNLDGIVPSLSRRGTATPYFWGPPTFAAWRGPVQNLRWSYRLYCGTHAGAWINYGTAKAGSGGVAPRLRGLGFPNTSNTIHVQLSRGRGATPMLLVMGARVALPFQYGRLYAVPTLSLPFTLRGSGVGGGYATLDLRIPNDARLRGVRLASQAWILDAGATQGLAHSGGLQFVLGH